MLKLISDKWVILIMVALWTVVIAVADMNWPQHMGPNFGTKIWIQIWAWAWAIFLAQAQNMGPHLGMGPKLGLYFGPRHKIGFIF